MRSRRVVGARGVTVAFVVAALAATTMTAAGGQTGSSASTPGVTDTSVKVGGVATLSSPFGFGEPNVPIGFQARIERENRAGGVNGRKIDFVGVKDDNLDPTKSTNLTRELVQQDEVFAVAPIVTPIYVAAGDYLRGEKVPYLGWGVTPAFCANTYGFGFDGCLFPTDPTGQSSTLQGSLAAALLKQQGKKAKGMTVATQAEDVQAGQVSVKASTTAFKAAGFKVVYAESSVPIVGTTDWSPYVRQVMTSNNGGPPDIFNSGMTLQNALGMTAAMRNAGFKGIVMSPLFYDQSVIDSATANQAAQGAYAYTNYTPTEQKTAATKKLVSDVKKIDKTVVVDYQVEVGYWIADMFVQMLKKAGKDLTRESFLAAANSTSAGVPGGYGPTVYPGAHDVGGTCGALLLVKGKKFVPKVNFKCYPTTSASG